MKLQFSATEPYQLEAIDAIVNIFEGQPLAQGSFDVSFEVAQGSLALHDKGIANNLIISETQILENIQKIQAKNNIQISEKLVPAVFVSENEKKDKKKVSVSTNENIVFNRLNFTIEMETGTGKSYTFLRTIYELNKVYGFKKFVIVVPSVAIREGTIKNLQITHEHLQGLYKNPSVKNVMYDRNNLSSLRNFAVSNAIEILVINVDSFAKDNNVINTMRETGIKPITYIQQTKPIVIIDEPQNFETNIRQQAIANLNPLFVLRYSATHRNLYNLVYSLNPVKAYDLGLVKQIEVSGITANDNYNGAYIHVQKLDKDKKQAKITIQVQTLHGVSHRDIWVKVESDLYQMSGGREHYKNNYVVEEIDFGKKEIRFLNGIALCEGSTQSDMSEDILKTQMERTIKIHFEKEIALWREGKTKGYSKIKVITLFFINKVSNYRKYDEQGNPSKGKFALWFEELFEKYANKHKNDYIDLFTPEAPNSKYFDVEKAYDTEIPLKRFLNKEKVHNGYFAQDKKGKLKDTKGDSQDDEDIYALIMRDKEKLLSVDEPLRFIFSHSALREGWDNPNVFQICTLNDTKSELKKRQEIGRGLRLCVDSTGRRVHSKKINVLTIIPNEHYEDFAKALQQEIEEETSVKFGNRIKNADLVPKKKTPQPNKEITRENYPEFFEIWDKISKKTVYNVQYDTKDLVENVVKKINQMPFISRPVLDIQTAKINYTELGIKTDLQTAKIQHTEEKKYLIPDVYAYIQNSVEITRSTIYKILSQVNNLQSLFNNPKKYLEQVISCIKETLEELLVGGIEYEFTEDSYKMEIITNQKLNIELEYLFTVSATEKTLFDYIHVESNVEKEFAKDCEIQDEIKFFIKLPRAFKIPTPIGNYTPDWAVVFENDTKIYFVAETKASLSDQNLRGYEKMKIDCGKKHFSLFKQSDVDYRVVTKVKELFSNNKESNHEGKIF
jgi:type III restriction enzyme